MTLEQLRIFAAVATQLNMTRASEMLRLSQSAVSAAISALERRHDVKLFDRVGRGIALTSAGAVFLTEAKDILNRAQQAERVLEDLSTLRRGSIQLVASQTVGNYWLPRQLMSFHTANPDIDLSIEITNSDRVMDWITTGKAELGFIESPVTMDGLEATQVGTDQMVLIGPRDLGPQIDRTTLMRLPWVIREEGSGTRAMLLEFLTHYALTLSDIRIALVLPSNEAIATAVSDGLGIALMSRLAAGFLGQSAQIAIRPSPQPDRALTMVLSTQRHCSSAVQAFVSQIKAGSTQALD